MCLNSTAHENGLCEDVLASEEPWFCPRCDYEAPAEAQVHGHIGAKHIRKLRPIRHGSIAGYRAEKRRSLQTCSACRVAWRRYYANRRATGPRKGVRL